MQRIVISQFGPIEKFEADIQDVMLFIGPQASGKSTISKAIYFCKSIKDELMTFFYELEQEGINSGFGTFYGRLIRRFFEYFDYPVNHPLNIQYYYSNIRYYYSQDKFILIKYEKYEEDRGEWAVSIKFNQNFEQELIGIFEQAQQSIQTISSRKKSPLPLNELLQIETEKRSALKVIERYLVELFEDDTTPIFIPAGRSLISTLTEQQNIGTVNLDFFTRTFWERINVLRPYFKDNFHSLVREKYHEMANDANARMRLASELIKTILKGEYRFEKGMENIYYAPDNAVKLNYASSGQQEAVWILLLIFKYLLDETNVFIVFEEPEAHLYPEAQKSMVELIALLANHPDNQVLLTTHSPYILSAFNNLLYADQVAKKNVEAKQKVTDIIDPNCWIDVDRAAAYFVDGITVGSIIDPELRLIQAEKIDSASQLINNMFNALFDLDE